MDRSSCHPGASLSGKLTEEAYSFLRSAPAVPGSRLPDEDAELARDGAKLAANGKAIVEAEGLAAALIETGLTAARGNFFRPGFSLKSS